MVGHMWMERERVEDRTRRVVDHEPMTVGRANDPAERDADGFAAGLLGELDGSPMGVQRESVGASADRLGGTSVDPSIASRIRAAGGGRPLPDSLRRVAEHRSGRDLSSVRVHTGAEAADLSASLDARAFTTGNKIFLGAGGAGADVLAHEVGHVVQQGGGATVGRIRRSTALRPLQFSTAPTVHRLFGLGGKGKGKGKVDEVDMTTSPKPVLEENKALIKERDKLRKDIKNVESALAKLSLGAKGKGKRKGPAVGSAESAELAAQVQAAAMQLLAGMSSQAKGKAGDQMGIFNGEKARLQQVVDQAQRLVDLHQDDLADRRLVKASKAAGQQAFMEAGQKAADPTAGGSTAAFTQLETKVAFRQDLAPDASAVDKRAAGTRAFGASMGLTPAEIAAIGTFTSIDYQYINPAAANSRSWMKAWYSDLDDATVERRMEEGSAHTAVAMQGLAKLPVWTGTTWRGERMKFEKFDEMFKLMPKKGGRQATPVSMLGTSDSMEIYPHLADKYVEAKSRRFTWNSLASTAHKRHVALLYAQAKGGEIPVIYQFELTNGRLIEDLSLQLTDEAEVATLPGATFVIDRAEWDVLQGGLLVFCRQIK